ncbi:MAG TPA: glycosyltransferase, partial [Candidatus Acidoferrales bacterium]|nr:glycosyltransferase [Candidatus Acidoferrales bacterium]
DFASYENFVSFCRQDYPEYELLFAVNDESDAAVPLVRQLMTEFPERPIRLLIGAEQIGSNKKVNKLVRLAREAANSTLVLTDGDVRVSPNFLREVVAPLSDANTGAVTCLYRAVAQRSFWAELESLGTATDFAPSVLMANWLEGVRFGLGAAIATSKPWIEKIGGLEPIASMHSDDYELGYRIAKAGGTVRLSREVVATMYPAESFAGFWHHQIRWARTVRVSRPASFVGLIFTHGLPWAIVAAILAPRPAIAAVYLAAYLVLRLAMAWTVGVWGMRDDVARRKLWLLPLRDAIHFLVWIASFGSNRIHWGGRVFAMRRREMIDLEKSEATARSAGSLPGRP